MGKGAAGGQGTWPAAPGKQIDGTYVCALRGHFSAAAKNVGGDEIRSGSCDDRVNRAASLGTKIVPDSADAVSTVIAAAGTAYANRAATVQAVSPAVAAGTERGAPAGASTPCWTR